MDRRVQKVIRLLESDDHYLQLQDPLNELAKSVGLSGSRLRHIFRADTDLSLGQFLTTLRLIQAKQLLETSNLRVQEVVAKVGMNSESHFSRIFKKTYGVTPRFCRAHAVVEQMIRAEPVAK